MEGGCYMSRELILSQITDGYSNLGLSFSQGLSSDIEIHSEFLNAGWSIGKKKILYDAFLYANESEKMVYLWEMTKETGGGVSFGGGIESFSQTGATAFRKVKSVQYGPEGKVFEITLDLGAIPRIAKEAAKQYGWKFQTVVKADKAKHP